MHHNTRPRGPGRALLLSLGLLTAGPSLAQVAQYDFDGDLLDSIGPYDGAGSNTVFVAEGGRQFLRLEVDAVATFPTELNTAVFGPYSWLVSFDFRLAADDDYSILWGVADDEGGAIWQRGGPKLLVHESSLIFTVNDGVDPDGYVWADIGNGLVAGTWYSLTLTVNTITGFWRAELDGQVTQGSVRQPFDSDAFRAAIAGSQTTLGGQAGEKIGPYTGTYDIDNLGFTAPAPTQAPAVNAAFLDLADHIRGLHILDEAALEERADVIVSLLPLQLWEDIAVNLVDYTQAYETAYPPLYQDGVNSTFENLPPLDRVLQFAQQHQMQILFVPGRVHETAGIVFEHHEVMPGTVAPGIPRVASATVSVDGTYHRDVAAELSDQERVVRPTGHYAPPGELITIEVPANIIGKGLSVIVGAHFRDMDYDYIGAINRFPDISLEFPLDAASIQVANPLGGAIFLKVPEGSDAGWFDMTIRDAIVSPYFSWREGRQTDVSDWLAQVAASGAPWADFESDKFMFTIPTRLLAGVDRPDLVMTRWDDIMDAVRIPAGRAFDRPRAEYYSFDSRLVTPAYGAGYPLVIPIWELESDASWNPLAVLQTRPHRTLLHEMGHNHLDPTLNFGSEYDPCLFIEAETIVHMLGMSVYDNVYGLSMEEAFRQSREEDYLSFEQAAVDWFLTTNFRSDQPMTFDTSAPLGDQDMLKYQSRGHAKYGDIARLFGWAGLSAVNGAFYTPGVPQASTVCPWRPFIVGRDEYIRAATEALGVNMTPLFHLWGIKPSPALAAELAAYPPSTKIMNLIINYRDNVAPKSKAEYLVYHDQFPTDDYQFPRYAEYEQQFDAAFAKAMRDQFNFLLATYFSDVRPVIMSDGFEAPSTP